jgi:DNA polymerase delta subunit 2
VPASIPAGREETALGPYIAFVSGLFIGASDEDVEARKRVADFFTGKSEKEAGTRLAKEVQRLVVCGGTFGMSAKLGDVPPGLADADSFFAQVSEHLPVDVLPGQQDPSNLSMPQMPMHPYLFRTAVKSNKFKSVSNPYQCTMEDLHILGHSGQPVDNLLRCTSMEKPLEALTKCLDARLLAPTAPDTLGTQPFADVDPFVIDKVPHILFSGGHDKLEFEWRASTDNSGTLCICIPAFSKQPAVVLVNLRDPRDVQVHELGAETLSTGL